jgi:CubicO group peptidase (beta-lactamase class C family)
LYTAANIRRDRSEKLDTFMTKLAKMPLRYQPGERWMYSLATDVCGALVERISGKPFDQYLEETIFGPLGMKDTAFHVPPAKAERFAANYRRGPNKRLVLGDDPQSSAYLTPPAFLSGGGGLAGTLADYVRFCEMLRRGGELDGERIIGSRTLALMRLNHLEGGKLLTDMAIDSFSETANDGVGFGLGFAMVVDPVKAMSPSVGDYYWGGAASTIFWVDPTEDLFVVFLTQLMPSATFNFRGQLKALVYGSIID